MATKWSRSDGNERVLHIPQTSCVTVASPLGYFVSYSGHSYEGVLLLCRDAVGVFCSPSRLGYAILRTMSNSRVAEKLLEDQDDTFFCDGIAEFGHH